MKNIDSDIKKALVFFVIAIIVIILAKIVFKF